LYLPFQLMTLSIKQASEEAYKPIQSFNQHIT
jgi:hypothetical protein